MIHLTHFLLQSQTSVLRLFSKFVREHTSDLETAFLQQDKDQSGKLSCDDLKTAFKTAGLRLTSVSITDSPMNKVSMLYEAIWHL